MPAKTAKGRREAALKAWKTRRVNTKKKMRELKDLKHRLMRIQEVAKKVNERTHKGDLLVEIAEIARGNE